MSVFAASCVFGFAQSLHCAGMCGPLACCASGVGALGYQLARVTSYTLLGTVAGTLGLALGADQLAAPARAIAIFLAVCLLAFAVFGERIVPASLVSRVATPLLARAARLPRFTRGIALGALTPLLPCGLLWAALAAAAVTGSAWSGGAAMLGFALGSLPLLALAQRAVRGMSGSTRRALMIVGALVLLGRAALSTGGGSCCG